MPNSARQLYLTSVLQGRCNFRTQNSEMGGRAPAEDSSKTFFRYIIGKGMDNSEKKETLTAMGKGRKMK